MSDREETAVHEAGHFVAEVRLRPDRYRSTISIVAPPNASHAGSVQTEEEWSDDRQALEAEVLCLVAGYAAQISSGADPARARLGAGSDFEKAEALIRLWHLAPLTQHIAAASSFVTEPRNRRAIDVIARELLERGTIDADEAEILLDVLDGSASAEDLLLFRSLKAAASARPDRPDLSEK